ncbi:zinc finger protein BRUTUS-like At1g18910 isoform X1 [Lactuca sativa]|uniref:zinc finger protein BRUTUS-like At1g18910 isoform X1 n=2 Tax=Lactuca sativa TaxID=4236 RepID=UPI000CB95195|nr:zinc finger protein BRUTUS-like At1g18910 isoform X1 [Lactuca sativa]XP_023734230.1 zinc finger protein BRUTUS-like At1g18910 isoform X1 [Lactuca sativa]
MSSAFELAVIPGVRLREAPVLLLLHFHNALREEVTDLRRTAAEALDSRIYGVDLIQELRRRFEFLKLVNKYHSVAEDEVIFRALDVHVKNVVSAYSLEHTSSEDILDSIFHYLDVLEKEDERSISKPFQELVYFICTLQSSICKHMAKEEEQVFPLLTQQFTTEEQASFVWQFICSVPMLLLEDFFQWMNSFLSSDERENVLQCLREVVPKDIFLQEVVISCLKAKEENTSVDFDKYGKGSLFLNGQANFRKILEVYSSEGDVEEHPIPGPIQYSPWDGARLWHAAFSKDLLDVLEELYSIQDSNDFSGLVPAIVQLKFFADAIIFYSNALDKLFYSMCIELAEDCPAPSYQRFLDDSQIEGLQLLLYSKNENVLSARDFLEKLCHKLKISAIGIRKYLTFVEKDVFPYMGMNCSRNMQRRLLYASLEMMPLGLLKCIFTWFSSRLSEEQSKSIMHSIKQGGLLINNSLSSLLHEWVRIGYSGKTSVEKFRMELREVFDKRCSFVSEHIKNDSGFPYFQLDTQLTRSNISNTSYSTGINYRVFFPQKPQITAPFSTYPIGNNNNNNHTESSFRYLESKPVDHIFFFHKALKKDMEHLASLSASLAGEKNYDLFSNFYKRFHLLRVLHKVHSDAEDEIAFPVLEAKEIIQNISQSYSIDHKMDIEYFNRISYVLDQISKFHFENGDDVIYRQLCVKLHDMCKCMNKMLSDHVDHEEIELWPLFREHLSPKEQEKIIGCMLGRTRAETLQEMIPWLMAFLTVEEQNAMMSLWRKVTKNTMFDQWLGEWWEGMKRYDVPNVEKSTQLTKLTRSTPDAMEIVSKYSPRGNMGDLSEMNTMNQKMIHHEDDRDRKSSKKQDVHDCKVCSEMNNTSTQISSEKGVNLVLSQEELEATIRRVHCDESLEPQTKSIMIQNLIMSPWINTQRKSDDMDANEEIIPGICPSYRDSDKLVFGCKHYKRNCKLLASCCNKLFSCRRCHDDATDHSMDRKATTMMMCMKCLIIQPVGPTCSTVSCNGLSMARYYCSICKLFDDERQIYHCPYCNLCRVGKGLGLDYFHCMNCNACMSKSLSVHICREKCLEDNCPICHEYIFTSSNPVKSLPCGHIMHSSCFKEYTCSNYTCPICSKSLGDMQVYFAMLDAMLAEETIPDEYSGRTQDILCNDCEKRGTTSFHWLYHKCPGCGSYNTRVI